MTSPIVDPQNRSFSLITTNSHSDLCGRTPLAFTSSHIDPTSEPSSVAEVVRTNRSAIAPADHGRAAWLFLAGCFLIEGLVWGLPFSYGIFLDYYSTHLPFSAHPHNIAAVGTTTTGFTYFVSPFAVIVLQRWPSRRMFITVTGLALLIIGLISASFATRVSDLIITQGAIYGIGGALIYNPFVFYLDEWFIARKGLAFGILWAGTGVGGAVIPLIMDWSLGKYGFRTTLRLWAVVIIILVSPLVYLVKPRLPPPPKGAQQPLNLRFFRTWIFWLLQLGNIVEGMGYFMPSLYLPTYASTILHLSHIPSTLLISLLNLSSVLGTVFIGSLTDHLHPPTVILISALGSAASVFLLWGFATTTSVLYIFAFFYGIFAGGYTATWTGCVSEIQRDAREAEAGVVIGMMAAGRGLGAVSSGSLSECLLGYLLGGGKGAYGGRYGVMIVFTGATAVVGGLGFLTKLRFRNVDAASIEGTMAIRYSHEDTRAVIGVDG